MHQSLSSFTSHIHTIITTNHITISKQVQR
jgi:hypothetical protein